MPLLWLSLAFLAGILAAAGSGIPALAWALLAGAALILFLLGCRLGGFLNRLQIPPLAALLLLAFCLGALRCRLAQPGAPTPQDIAYYNDLQAAYVLEGVIIQPPDERDTYTNLRVRLDRIYPDEAGPAQPIAGLLLARVSPGGDWRYGDRLRLDGAPQTPPQDEEFSYRDYLARQGVFTWMPFPRTALIFRDQGSPLLAAIYRFKDRALAEVYRLFPDPEASLLAGILLGVETGISQPVRQAFQDTGTAHIIAISGFNITILAGLFMAVFSRLLGRWRGAVAATIGIVLYAILVGGGAAVVRAALMGGLSVYAVQLGRRQDGLNSLAFVAALMALATPDVLWDVGFQLSFAATLGLVLYAGPMTAFIAGWAQRFLPVGTAARVAALVGEYFLFTLAAQLTTLPVTAYHFRSIPLIALLANPLILPAQPAVMLLGGAALILGLVFHPLGQAAAYLAWPFVAFTIRAVEWMGQFSGSVLRLGEFAPLWVFAFYALLLGATFGGWRWNAALKKIRPAVAAAALAALVMLVWRAALAAPDGRLHLVLLDVSSGGRSGEAVLIQTPGGRYVLVNGGPSPSALSDALGRWLPLDHRRLDVLLVAAPGENQVLALPRSIERFPTEQVLWAGPTHGAPAARSLQTALAARGIQPVLLESGHALDLGQGARLEVLYSGSRGVVLLLRWASFRALLPLGLDFDGMQRMQRAGLPGRVDVLLLADSGYAPLNPPEWITYLDPRLALLSVAPGDRDGLPDAATLAALGGRTLLRTDRNGWIQLSTDGEQMWVEVERR